MNYLLIYEDTYEGYTLEFEELNAVVNYMDRRDPSNYRLLKVINEINLSELIKKITDDMEEARERAISKLTEDERILLGIS